MLKDVRVRIGRILFAGIAFILGLSGAELRAAGPDVTICQLYDLVQYGRSGDIVGLALATTSLNLGDESLLWYRNPDPLHPFIASNLYRQHDNRIEQIGQSWVKHGFYATNLEQCDLICQHPGTGELLGPGCTDTYASVLNASQIGLGPRHEINPWTGGYVFEGSHLDDPDHTHNGIDHRLQVHDADLDPMAWGGATYVMEGYYVTSDDVDHRNSSAWKTVTVSGVPGGTWTFKTSVSTVPPTVGPALDAWYTTQTEVWGIDDGRCLLAYDVTDNGDGTWHYEYALYNLDMDRQVRSFRIPVVASSVLTHIEFHDVDSHGEDYSNDDWTVTRADGFLTWETEPFENNPLANSLRWGTLYNFRFDADTGPIDRNVTLGLFKPGTPTELTGPTVGPTTPGDCNENGVPDGEDLGSGTSSDCNGNKLPDECDSDCDDNGVPDECDTANDCDGNGVPDLCELVGKDCNGNGLPDVCDLADNDCNASGVPDECEMLFGDCNLDGELDECDPDGADPVILEQPVGGTACVGDEFTFHVEALGTGDVYYFWLHDDELIFNAYEDTLTLTNVQSEDAGVYTALIGDDCQGFVVSDPALLAVDDCLFPPQIVSATSVAVQGALGELGVNVGLVNNHGPDGAQPTTDSRLGSGAKVQIVFDKAMNEAVAENPANVIVTGLVSGMVDSASISATLTDGTLLTLTFPGLPGGTLFAKDRYTFDLSLLQDTEGNPVGDGDDSAFDLRMLVGDGNGDGVVDPLDAGAVQSRFGIPITEDPRYDINADGVGIDPLDSGAVLSRFGDSAP